MSYVVCSNSTDDDKVLTGIASATSFQNFFRSPLEIEPNSEIAVESVKINREDKFDVVAEDEFFIYFGEELTSVTLSGSVSTNAVSVRVPVGSYDRNTFAVALTNAINSVPLNPAINGGCLVTVKQTSNVFDGFDFKFTIKGQNDSPPDISGLLTTSQVAEGNATTVKFNSTQINAGSSARAFEYIAGSSTINCCSTRPSNVPDYSDKNNNRYFASDSVARFQTQPLSNAGGHYILNLKADNASDSWMTGLSRPTTPYYNYGYPKYLTQTGQNSGAKQARFLSGGVMCDFWVEWSNACTTTGGIDKLSVKHWGKQTDPQQWVPTEIEYWKNANSPFHNNPINTVKMNASKIEYVIFKLVGNELQLYLSQTPTIISGKSFHLVDSSKTKDTTIAKYNFPPLGNSEEFLSPVIGMTNSAQSFIIENLETYDNIPKFSFPTTASFRTTRDFTPRADNPLLAGSDWWSQAEVSSRGQKEIRFNELRPSTLWYANKDAIANYRFKGLNASGTMDYNVVMIPNKETFIDDFNQYKQQLYIIPIKENQANMGRTLGFSTFPQIKQSLVGVPPTSKGQVIFSSFNAGEFAVSSCFVRINDLTIRSYNGAKQSRSNIIYHIPRFTNDGKQYGELYFNAPEKTYLKLNNTDKIMLNNLKIDIVDRNEVVVDDLTGSTIVALHIRESK